MRAIVDFVAGRSNKLLRDMLTASALVALTCVGAATVIRSAVDAMRVAQQPLPSRLEAARPPAGANGPIVTITRSVLDDPILTGSIGGRTIVLDPCTGKDKK